MNDSIAPVKATRIYRDGKKLWVPHYNLKGVYVTQGGATKTRMELMAERALPDTAMLWPRGMD
jgi:hypothetical protein